MAGIACWVGACGRKGVGEITRGWNGVAVGATHTQASMLLRSKLPLPPAGWRGAPGLLGLPGWVGLDGWVGPDGELGDGEGAAGGREVAVGGAWVGGTGVLVGSGEGGGTTTVRRGGEGVSTTAYSRSRCRPLPQE